MDKRVEWKAILINALDHAGIEACNCPHGSSVLTLEEENALRELQAEVQYILDSKEW